MVKKSKLKPIHKLVILVVGLGIALAILGTQGFYFGAPSFQCATKNANKIGDCTFSGSGAQGYTYQSSSSQNQIKFSSVGICDQSFYTIRYYCSSGCGRICSMPISQFKPDMVNWEFMHRCGGVDSPTTALKKLSDWTAAGKPTPTPVETCYAEWVKKHPGYGTATYYSKFEGTSSCSTDQNCEVGQVCDSGMCKYKKSISCTMSGYNDGTPDIYFPAPCDARTSDCLFNIQCDFEVRSEICQQGVKKCSAIGDVETCNKYDWVVSEECQYACSNAECTECKDGDTKEITCENQDSNDFGKTKVTDECVLGKWKSRTGIQSVWCDSNIVKSPPPQPEGIKDKLFALFDSIMASLRETLGFSIVGITSEKILPGDSLVDSINFVLPEQVDEDWDDGKVSYMYIAHQINDSLGKAVSRGFIEIEPGITEVPYNLQWDIPIGATEGEYTLGIVLFRVDMTYDFDTDKWIEALPLEVYKQGISFTVQEMVTPSTPPPKPSFLDHILNWLGGWWSSIWN